MLKKTKLCTSLTLACGGVLLSAGGAAVAQTEASTGQQLERVEITGSAIRRIDAETAVPVTILRIEDLKKQGITTIEQVLQNVSSSQSSTGTSQSVGSSNGGVAFADLRGLGANKTLVLLNGRRIANNAYLNRAPDLSTIPFAALDRIEILRDGASALYGTDAIGGVINFITRRDFTGGSITVGVDHPEGEGGKAYNYNIGLGFGDLSKDKYNVFGFFDYQKQQPVGGLDRPFNARLPGGLSPTTFPANYFQGGATGNPAAAQAGGCSTTVGLIPSNDGTGCQITTSSFVDYIPRTERYSGMLKGTLKIADSMNASLEYFGAHSEVQTRIAPVPYGGLYQNRTRPDGSLNPYYPGNPGSSVGTPNIPLSPTYTEGTPGTNPAGSAGRRAGLLPGFVHVRFRDFASGNRVGTNVNQQHRLVGALDGTVGGWDYNGAVTFNQNRQNQYISGYSDGPIITSGVRDGVINPFASQNATGAALIAGAGRAGLLTTGKGTVTGADLKFSRELGDWLKAGRPAAIAVGAEARHEKFQQGANADFATLVIASTGIDPNTSQGGSRNVYAGFVELNVPVLKELELTAAVRYDKYSDFGNTTNPKFGFRYEPVKQLLVRGSYSTGFRAPSLYDLNAAQTYTNTGTFNDPVRCPGGVPIPGASAAANCQVQFQALQGGNTQLKAEKSKNATLGIVFEPIKNLSAGVDFFWIKVDKQIGAIADTTIISDPATFGAYYHRLPDGSLSTDGSSCPDVATCGYLDTRSQNLGNTKTSGLDFSGSYRLMAGAAGNYTFATNTTYLLKYEYQDYINGPYNQNISRYSGAGPIFRWQSNASILWTGGAFGAGVFGHYKSGYEDFDPKNRVAAYTTFDVYGSWTPVKSLQLILGARNVFDKDPPFSNQKAVFQANYDPRYTDPTGRTYYLRGTYSF